MTHPFDRLLDEALDLPDDERAELATRLIASLPEIRPDLSGDEIARRIDELERGTVETIPWSEARLLMKDDKPLD